MTAPACPKHNTGGGPCYCPGSIYAQEALPQIAPLACKFHHNACNCREHSVSVLVKAALDAAVELDWMKNVAGVKPEDRDNAEQIVGRIHAAGEALGEDVGKHEVTA